MKVEYAETCLLVDKINIFSLYEEKEVIERFKA